MVTKYITKGRGKARRVIPLKVGGKKVRISVKPAMTVSEAEVEKNRKFWDDISVKHGWRRKKLYIQCWIDRKGNITDSLYRQEGQVGDMFVHNDEVVKVNLK